MSPTQTSSARAAAAGPNPGLVPYRWAWGSVANLGQPDFVRDKSNGPLQNAAPPEIICGSILANSGSPDGLGASSRDITSGPAR